MAQNGLFDKMITVTICSSKGHRKYQVEISRAREFLIVETKKSRLWLYIDGIQMDLVTIDENILCSSDNIILTNALIGG